LHLRKRIIVTAIITGGVALAMMHRKNTPSQQAEQSPEVEFRSYGKAVLRTNLKPQLVRRKSIERRVAESFDSDNHDDITQ
jgi:hypothetical protein